MPEAQLDRFIPTTNRLSFFDDELLLLLDKFEKVLDNLNEVLNSYEIEEIKQMWRMSLSVPKWHLMPCS